MSACPKCGYRKNTGCGVIRTCLDCFRRRGKTLHSIHYFMYGALRWGHLLKNPGTCGTLSCDKSTEQVIEVASKLLGSNGFGAYHVITNNCEHFATYCQTGVNASEQAAFYSVLEKKLRNGKEWLKKFVE